MRPVLMMKEESVRIKRVASLLKHLVADILEREINDPRLALTSVTKVKVSNDLRNATVFVSILGDENARKETYLALEHVRPKVAALLGERVQMRWTPRICFRRDKGVEKGFRIMEILDDLHRGGRVE